MDEHVLGQRRHRNCWGGGGDGGGAHRVDAREMGWWRRRRRLMRMMVVVVMMMVVVIVALMRLVLHHQRDALTRQRRRRRRLECGREQTLEAAEIAAGGRAHRMREIAERHEYNRDGQRGGLEEEKDREMCHKSGFLVPFTVVNYRKRHRENDVTKLR